MEEGEARHGGTALVLDGGGADLISALPEDLLIQVLRRLGCARAAARTSLLSRHWRGLWRRITHFTFRNVALETLRYALDSLARVPQVLLLDIRISEVAPIRSPRDDKHNQHAARVSSLLCAAADLSLAELRFGVLHSALPRQITPNVRCHSLTVHLPCFLHATSIDLHGLDLLFTDPPASWHMFPVLKTLYLSACRVDFHALVLQCPRLCVLRATDCLHGNEDITVRSASLRELLVRSRGKWTGRIDFEVPALNRLLLSVFVDDKLNVSISAPVVEKVLWHCAYSRGAVAGIGLWGLAGLRLDTESHVLSLLMSCLHQRSFTFPHTELNLAQEIEKNLVVTNFSVLDLHFITAKHAFGAFLVCLLRIDWIRTATKSLKISLQGKEKSIACPANCPCDAPKNWRSQTISLINLEEVEIKVFEGEDHEFGILRLIFKCAPMLKRVIVRLSDEISTSSNWCMKIDDIFKAYPSVECSVYPSAESWLNAKKNQGSLHKLG